MELREALTQIAEIRRRMARAELFRGFRALPVAFSGLLAFAAASFQPILAPDPERRLGDYLALWIGAAAVSVLGTGVVMAQSLRASASVLERQKTVLAIGQFLPCLAAGALLLVVIVRFTPESAWMLPGLWAMFFGLGVFATCRVLPRAMVGVGTFYLAAGAICLILARGEYAFSPWAMGLPFGVGQLLTAGLLYWTLEGDDGQKQQD
jgi:hypothetical protein